MNDVRHLRMSLVKIDVFIETERNFKNLQNFSQFLLFMYTGIQQGIVQRSCTSFLVPEFSYDWP